MKNIMPSVSSEQTSAREFASSNRSAFEGGGLAFRGKIMGHCDTTGIIADHLAICENAMNAVKITKAARKKKRVEILLQLECIRVTDANTMKEIQCHPLSTLMGVWKNPSCDRIIGIRVSVPSTSHPVAGDSALQLAMLSSAFYAFKMERKVEGLYNNLKLLYTMWSESEKEIRSRSLFEGTQVHEAAVEKAVATSTTLKNDSPPETDLLDLFTDVPTTHIPRNENDIHSLEKLLTSPFEEAKKMVENIQGSINSPHDKPCPVTHDPWTGQPLLSLYVSSQSDQMTRRVNVDTLQSMHFSRSSQQDMSNSSDNIPFDLLNGVLPYSSGQSYLHPVCEMTTACPAVSSAFKAETNERYQSLHLSTFQTSKRSPFRPSATNEHDSRLLLRLETVSDDNSTPPSTTSQLFSDLVSLKAQDLQKGNHDDFEKVFGEAKTRRLSSIPNVGNKQNTRPSLNDLRRQQEKEWVL